MPRLFLLLLHSVIHADSTHPFSTGKRESSREKFWDIMTQPYVGKHSGTSFIMYVPFFPSLAVNSRGPVSFPRKKLLGPLPTHLSHRKARREARQAYYYYTLRYRPAMHEYPRTTVDRPAEGRKRDEDGMPPMATTHYTPTSPFFHPVVHARTAYLHTGTYREGNHRVSRTKLTLAGNNKRKKTINRKRDFSHFVFGEFRSSSS